MMSPTGSANASPPSEPSCYEDRPAEDDDVDLAVSDPAQRLVVARESDHVARPLVREDDLLLDFRSRGVEVAAAVAALDRLVLNLLGAVRALLHETGPISARTLRAGPNFARLSGAESIACPREAVANGLLNRTFDSASIVRSGLGSGPKRPGGRSRRQPSRRSTGSGSNFKIGRGRKSLLGFNSRPLPLCDSGFWSSERRGGRRPASQRDHRDLR